MHHVCTQADSGVRGGRARPARPAAPKRGHHGGPCSKIAACLPHKLVPLRRRRGADFEAGRVGRARSEEAPLGADPPSPLGRPGDAGTPVRGGRGTGPAAASQLPVQPRRLVRCVGKISSKITADTPRLFRNFNFRCVWSDGWTNNMLTLEQYAGGPSAAYGSWVILEKGSE